MLLGAASVLAGGTAQAQHVGDIVVGQSAAGQLKIHPDFFVPGDNYAYLAPVVPPLQGWGDDDPGFDHATVGDPANDIYPLQPGAQIRLMVVSCDPAFRLIDGGFQFLDQPGEQTYLGNQNLHIHNIWNINSDDPQYDPAQCVWHFACVLFDTGSTGYATSEPLSFSFTNVPLREADGDFDQDDGVDLADADAFYECLNGPDVLPAPDDPDVADCEVECLNAFDFDEDRDIDLEDQAVFQRVYAE